MAHSCEERSPTAKNPHHVADRIRSCYSPSMLPRTRQYLVLLAEMRTAFERAETAQRQHPEGCDFIDGAKSVTEFWYDKLKAVVEDTESIRIKVRDLREFEGKETLPATHRQSQPDENGSL